MAIFEEQILEPFVGRGIGNSGVASRQIQASNLPDLRSAILTSNAQQDELARQSNATIQAQNLVNNTRMLTPNKATNRLHWGANQNAQKTKPFVLNTSGKYTTIAIPKEGGGFRLENIFADTKQREAKLKAFGINPLATTTTSHPLLGALYGDMSKEQLLSKIFKEGNANDVNLKRLIDTINQSSMGAGGGGGSSVAPGRGKWNMSPDDKAWQAKQDAKQLEQAKLAEKNKNAKAADWNAMETYRKQKAASSTPPQFAKTDFRPPSVGSVIMKNLLNFGRKK